MQRAAELARAKFWLAREKKIPKKRVEAIINLQPIKDEVLELVKTNDKLALKQSLGAFSKDMLQVHGVPLEKLELEFTAAERYCNGV